MIAKNTARKVSTSTPALCAISRAILSA